MLAAGVVGAEAACCWSCWAVWALRTAAWLGRRARVGFVELGAVFAVIIDGPVRLPAGLVGRTSGKLWFAALGRKRDGVSSGLLKPGSLRSYNCFIWTSRARKCLSKTCCSFCVRLILSFES